MHFIDSEEFELMTPMGKMITWIESGCSTSGQSWQEFKKLMLESERFNILAAKTDVLLEQSEKFLNDN